MIQVINTYKCNFACGHCLFSCGPRKKGMIDTGVLRSFLEWVSPTDNEYVNYCGGETFLHPEWRLQIGMMAGVFENVRIVSNGSLFVTKGGNASKILKDLVEIIYFNNKCSFTILISDDEFHDEFKTVDTKYILSLMRDKMWHLDNIEVEIDDRRRSQCIIPLGKALDNGVYTRDGNCSISEDNPMADITIDPYGHIYTCCNAHGYVGTMGVTPVGVMEDRMKSIVFQKGGCINCKYINIDKKLLKSKTYETEDEVLAGR